MLNQNQTARSKGFTRFGADDERGPKTATSVDVHVGAKLRTFREIAGVTQDALATALGVTFQQVQKYEKGMNRISPARISAAADFLGVSPMDFFADLKKGAVRPNKVAPVLAALETVDGVRVCRAFARIKNPKLRTRVASVVESFVEANS